jgi:DNA-binding response OmpR family regulator
MCQPANETAKQLYLDDRDRFIYLDGMRITLTEQEYLLLSELAQHAGEAVSRQDLLRKAWGYLSPGDTRTVDVHIQRLRGKIGADRIETIVRYGYRFREDA